MDNTNYSKKAWLYITPCCEICFFTADDIISTSDGVNLQANGQGEDWVLIYR